MGSVMRWILISMPYKYYNFKLKYLDLDMLWELNTRSRIQIIQVGFRLFLNGRISENVHPIFTLALIKSYWFNYAHVVVWYSVLRNLNLNTVVFLAQPILSQS